MNKFIIALVIVVPLLLVASVGWYYFAHPTPKLEVKEGHLTYQIGYEYPHRGSDSINTSKLYAISVINKGSGFLNFSLQKDCALLAAYELPLEFVTGLKAQVKMPHGLVPSGIKLEAQVIGNKTEYDFAMSETAGKNATFWKDKGVPGTWSPHVAYIGFTPTKSSFEVKSSISVQIWDPNLNKTGSSYHLILTAEILGFSEPVKSTIEIVIYRK